MNGKWIVEQYMDAVKFKSNKQADSMWIDKTPTYPHKFDTRAEAEQFVIDRARKNILRAEANLLKAKTQLKKVIRKFAAQVVPARD